MTSAPSSAAASDLAAPQVLWLDNHVLVLAKPAGMPSQGDASGDLSLLDWGKAMLKERFDKPGNVFLGLVQRLDRPTSGAMVFGRTSKAASRLSEAVRERRIDKTYLALCAQAPGAAPGLLQDWMLPGGEGTSTRVVRRDTPGAKDATLRWRPLAEGPEGLLVEVALLTGRKHQIRAQFAHRGAPLAGDARYGARQPFALGAIGLHAARLAFPHPVGGARVEVVAPLPPSFPAWARAASTEGLGT